MDIIDFHTHAFPDELAPRAMPQLAAKSGLKAFTDGTIGSLLRSMDAAGIERSVVACIATRPGQFPSILKWTKAIASERIIPFPSVHPDEPEAAEMIGRVEAEGLKGIKLHPYYQDFLLDEERMFPIYEQLQDSSLILLCHTGFELAYPRVKRCEPARVLKVLESFPGMTVVTSHLGAWQAWEESRDHFMGKPIYMELSFSIDQMPEALARELLLNHPKDYLLFGTDSPWAGQKETLDFFLSLDLGAEREAAILYENAERLLGLG
jgi:predicted TIM-barrel fold metal-dependent hydrolase